jgi:hypothetical protein
VDGQIICDLLQALIYVIRQEASLILTPKPLIAHIVAPSGKVPENLPYSVRPRQRVLSSHVIKKPGADATSFLMQAVRYSKEGENLGIFEKQAPIIQT